MWNISIFGIEKKQRNRRYAMEAAGTNRDLRSSLIALWVIGGLLIGVR